MSLQLWELAAGAVTTAQGSAPCSDTGKALKKIQAKFPDWLCQDCRFAFCFSMCCFLGIFYYAAILVGPDGLGTELWAYPECPQSQAFPVQAVEGLLLPWVWCRCSNFFIGTWGPITSPFGGKLISCIEAGGAALASPCHTV